MKPAPPALAAVVLCGGRASRLGGADKALLPLGDSTILGHILRRIAAWTGAVCISANGDPARFAAFGHPVIADGTQGAGPLLGVAAALVWADALAATDLLVIPGDTFFLPADLAHRLAPGPSVAVAGGRTHHLVCRLPVMCAPVLAAWLAQGHTRAGDFLRSIGARPVAFDDPAAFLNINTPDDLADARRRVAVPRPCELPP